MSSAAPALKVSGASAIEEFNHGKSHRQLLGTNVEQSKHFDQIAYIAPILKDRLEDCDAGVFNYYMYVYREEPAKVYAPDIPSKDEDDFKKWRTYQMSDHLPMWIELRVDFNYRR
jgi:hypothetical protein